ncbi:hypothetical protein [Actinacidiphila sp. ITFR-21]|uniref:hypothetical protein n=1 Tax=Actinacidiphila sp. ITFR-21 TaxID=3075199 RepID=UPI00288C53D5|nr:hypothetical protein [Streptomyces sp. ITFR-21]WNI17557.1 hypothetical protein RLT57_19905 [Streptomyces sp. ITFR-21]WNI17697.1 hypothetical protein RLT57_20620 [Streptomyces sp. ITFR-21]
MSYVVAKLKLEAGGDDLVVTDEIKVATKVEDAVNRIGGWNGDVFAVWDVDGRPNPAEAEGIAQSQLPESLWVIAGEMPFQIEDRYIETVRQDSRG